MPQIVSGEKYSQRRNAFLYNFVFVFGYEADVSSYYPILRKLSNLFRNFEIEDSFLSNPQINLSTILSQLMNDLNQKSETFININDAYSIYLKLFSNELDRNVEIPNYTVPIQIRDLSKIVKLNWDLTVLKILPLINGVNSVRKISKATHIEISLVKKSLKYLQSFNSIFLIDVFQYNNVYALVSKDKMIELFKIQKFQTECLEFIRAKNGVHINQILQVFSQMTFNAKFSRIVDRTTHMFSHRLLVVFGLIHGIIRRVYDYPIVNGLDKVKDVGLRNLLKNHASIDEICCELEYTKRDLIKMLKPIPDFKMMSK